MELESLKELLALLVLSEQSRDLEQKLIARVAMVVVTVKLEDWLMLKVFVMQASIVLMDLMSLLLDLLSSEKREVIVLREVSALLESNSLDHANLVDISDLMQTVCSMLHKPNPSVITVLKENTAMVLLKLLELILLTLLWLLIYLRHCPLETALQDSTVQALLLLLNNSFVNKVNTLLLKVEDVTKLILVSLFPQKSLKNKLFAQLATTALEILVLFHIRILVEYYTLV